MRNNKKIELAFDPWQTEYGSQFVNKFDDSKKLNTNHFYNNKIPKYNNINDDNQICSLITFLREKEYYVKNCRSEELHFDLIVMNSEKKFMIKIDNKKIELNELLHFSQCVDYVPISVIFNSHDSTYNATNLRNNKPIFF
jgi:hypothetical protein